MFLLDLGDSVQQAGDEFATWAPRLLGFLAVLIIGYIIAKVVAGVVRRLLQGAGLDGRLREGRVGEWISRATTSPSHLLGRIVFWLLFIGAISIAVSVLGVEALEDLVAAVWGYVPNLIAALLIFLVAAAIAAAVGTLVSRTMGETTTGKVIGTVVPALIMAIAGFMILDQLEIAETIVTITYAALMGAIALGMALAFGLGGRDVAARMLDDAYKKGRENREQIRRDFQTGRERARAQYNERVEGDSVVSPQAADEPVQFEPDPALETDISGRTTTRRSS
jgi:uncharacterized membrane protein YjjB (DUF3815 family)